MASERFLWTAIACAIMASAKAMTCPEPEDISPCNCIVYDTDQDPLMDIDCSFVSSEEQLAEIFSTEMPFNHFHLFLMQYNNNIKVLRDGVFGAATFQWIEIQHGSLMEVQEEALAGSYATLDYVNLMYNQLEVFPFSLLPKFTALTMLSLGSNQIAGMPLVRSDSLTFLGLGSNPLGELPVTAVQGLPNLKYCYFDSTNISTVYPGTFMDLNSLMTVDLLNNSISHVSKGTIWVADGGYVGLDYNHLTGVDVDAITGFGGFELLLHHNSLTALDEAIYRPLLERFSTVYLNDNPLTCGCDIAWLMTNPAYRNRLGGLETCHDGVLLTDLDPSMFDTCRY